MKNNIFAILAVLTILTLTTVGCHSQQPPSPPVTSCPTAVTGGVTFTEINPPTSTSVPASITGTTTTDTPGIGTWAYSVQAWAEPNGAPPYQTSVPSNTVQVTTTTADPVVHLSWSAPAITSTYPSYTYIASRAPCTVVGVPVAPPLNQPTTQQSMMDSSPITLVAILSKE